MRRIFATFVTVVLLFGTLPAPAAAQSGWGVGEYKTATPIKYLVVIFDENNSFDHYFGTYPFAVNPPGEPAFHAAPDTPSVNGLNSSLLTQNPNLVAPFRLDRSQAVTCDNDNTRMNRRLTMAGCWTYLFNTRARRARVAFPA